MDDQSPQDPVSHAAVRQSLLIAAAGLILGVVGDLFFHDTLPGINILLYLLAFLIAGALLVELTDERFNPVHALFALPALFFAAMLGILSSRDLAIFNLLLLAGALFVVVRYLTEPKFLGGGWSTLFAHGVEVGVLGWLEPFPLLREVGRWLALRRTHREGIGQGGAVLRGCLLALPVIIVFGVLLGSADVVFGDYLQDLTGWIDLSNLEPLIQHGFLIAFFGWGSLAALKIMLQKPSLLRLPDASPGAAPAPSFDSFLESQASSRPAPFFRLGLIESGIVLASVNLLFLAFVIIQAAYLFGGKSNITARGYTYAEYARRGFFELLAVSIFTLLLIGLLDRVTARPPHREKLFRALALGVIGMALVILASAFQRLSLYEDAYGFTRLRVLSHVFMIWLAVLFVVLVLDLLRVRPQVALLGALLVLLGFFATLDLMNMDAFIAARNIDRYHETGKLDIYYLVTLSNDAVPALASLLDELPPDRPEYQKLRARLGARLYELDLQHDRRRGLGYHYGEARAWDVLDARRGDLEGMIHPYIYEQDDFDHLNLE